MTRIKWIEAFWKRVKKDGASCWIWLGPVRRGFGVVRREDGKHQVHAHRASLEIQGTPVPDDHWVFQTCGQRLCVNPEHLVVLSNDEYLKITDPEFRTVKRGDKHGSAKLSDATVEEIRNLWANRYTNGETQTALAEKYGVTQAQISKIVNKRQRT